MFVQGVLHYTISILAAIQPRHTETPARRTLNGKRKRRRKEKIGKGNMYFFRNHFILCEFAFALKAWARKFPFKLVSSFSECGDAPPNEVNSLQMKLKLRGPHFVLIFRQIDARECVRQYWGDEIITNNFLCAFNVIRIQFEFEIVSGHRRRMDNGALSNINPIS